MTVCFVFNVDFIIMRLVDVCSFCHILLLCHAFVNNANLIKGMGFMWHVLLGQASAVGLTVTFAGNWNFRTKELSFPGTKVP